MTLHKRLFDLFFAVLMSIALAPVLMMLLIWLFVKEGRPLFYAAERMKGPDQSFRLWKLRTMENVADDNGVSGGDKASRITKTGAWLRANRLDEVPQLWNILRGDMSFVGPRPPLRQYVERFPETYRKVLRSRPGVTGLATLQYHAVEGELLARCLTAEETDATYAGVCIPQKAQMDLIYQQRQSMLFDLLLIWQTACGLMRRRG